MSAKTCPTAVPDPDDPYDPEWFDHTSLPCRHSVSGHLTHRTDGRCNWCPAYVKSAQVLHEGLELVDMSKYSSHDRRVRRFEFERSAVDVDNTERLDDTYGVEFDY